VDLLREELGIEARLIKGHGGIFEVRVAENVVAKKTFSGFPQDDDIVRAVAGALTGSGR
jgi:selenoprotein W-related protein